MNQPNAKSMALAPYKVLALSWQPKRSGDRLFSIIAVVCIVALLAFGLVLSSLEVPEQPRKKTVVPERVAKFITERKKPKPPPPVVKPKPKPKPPPPKPEEPEKPKVERKRPTEVKKPVTEAQKKAREKAKASGLLAHMSELNDLMDTPEVSEQVKRSVTNKQAAKETAGLSAKVLTANASKGSGGVDAKQYATTAGNTQLTEADLAATRAALAATEGEFGDGNDVGEVSLNTRSQEEITLVMDRYKGQLQSQYNRARRSNPALRGKLVLAITILPDGRVDAVEVVSSELNDSSLESRIVSRVKTFKFGAKDVDVVTVNYPIEFLP